jgi:hypothetical protein
MRLCGNSFQPKRRMLSPIAPETHLVEESTWFLAVGSLPWEHIFAARSPQVFWRKEEPRHAVKPSLLFHVCLSVWCGRTAI